MGVLQGKLVTRTLILLVVGLVFFGNSLTEAMAQQGTTPASPTQAIPTSPAPAAQQQNTANAKTVDSGNNGAADVAERLGITGYRAWVFSAITSIGAMIAWLGGTFFDYGISLFAANMVATLKWLGLDVAINEMWTIIRDLFNLLFIFGLIYSGFKIILDANDSASKRNVVTIVLAALLINFSLYVTQVIIDFSNVATYQIHQLMAAPAGETLWGVPVKNISNSFVYLSGVDTLASEDQKPALLNEVGAKTGEAEVNNIGSAILLALLFCIFYIILGFVFAACAAVLFTRFFTLSILMIFSPIMFLGWVLPGFKSHSSKWWSQFLNQALVGPALLFMIYLSLRALQGIGTTGREGGIIAVALYLVIVTAFLWASLRVANSLGAYGAAQVMSTTKQLVGKTTAGLTARGLRNTVGRVSQRYAESDTAKRRAANSWLGKKAFNLSRKVGDASFDARNVKGVGKKFGLGSGLKGGYATRTKEIVKNEQDFAKALGTISDDDPKVKQMQLESDAAEQAIKNEKNNLKRLRGELKEEKDPNVISQLNARIEASRAEIEDLEDKHNKAKESLQREKHSLQLGSLTSTQQRDIDSYKKGIGDALAEYATAPDEASKDINARKIANLKKAIAEEEKKAGGYANTVANKFAPGSKWWLLFQGRNAKQNEKASDEIIDEYKKKIKSKDKDKPKEKEDKGDKGKEGDKEAV